MNRKQVAAMWMRRLGTYNYGLIDIAKSGTPDKSLPPYMRPSGPGLGTWNPESAEAIQTKPSTLRKLGGVADKVTYKAGDVTWRGVKGVGSRLFLESDEDYQARQKEKELMRRGIGEGIVTSRMKVEGFLSEYPAFREDLKIQAERLRSKYGYKFMPQITQTYVMPGSKRAATRTFYSTESHKNFLKELDKKGASAVGEYEINWSPRRNYAARKLGEFKSDIRSKIKAPEFWDRGI